jgi:hypothetical protein
MASGLQTALDKVKAHKNGRPGELPNETPLTPEEGDALLMAEYKQCAECGRWLEPHEAIIYQLTVFCVDHYNKATGKKVTKRGGS